MGRITKIMLAISVCGVLYAKDVNNKVYATVGNEKITQDDISMILRNQKVNFNSLPKDLKKNIIDKLVERKILALNALKSDVVDSTEYKKALKALKEDLALQIWYKSIVENIDVTQKELKEFYNKNKNMFKQSIKLKARHILVKTKDEANKLIEKLKNSKNLEQKFIEFAKQYSTGPSGKQGGELGWFEPKMMVKEFSDVAIKLKPKSITLKPVKTQFGWHIIYLEDKQDEKILSFDEIKDKIKQQLIKEKVDKKIKNIIEKRKKELKIKYNF